MLRRPVENKNISTKTLQDVNWGSYGCDEAHGDDDQVERLLRRSYYFLAGG
jgi:hypothetical protein